MTTSNLSTNPIQTDFSTRTDESVRWTPVQLFAFRVAFIFFIAISIPNNPEWYRHVWEIDWFNLHYRDLYDIARFGSGINLFGNTLFGSSLLGYANWIISFLFSLTAAMLWTFAVRRKAISHYNSLNYWIHAIVRYRAAIGIIGFGFTKLLPVQMPYPSQGLLNTDFGDFTAQKIYWLSIGIVPWYQVFAGVVEIGAGALLFFRKTTFLGAALLFAALGDIVYVNFAYDGGVHVYSSYFVLLAIFLMFPYISALYRVFIKGEKARLSFFVPKFPIWGNNIRIAVKAATIFIFLVVLFYLQWTNFLYDPYKQPSSKGVNKLRGYYEVTSFVINGTELPYNPDDSVRWQEVTFEKWTSMIFKVNKAVPLDLSNGGGDPQRDINRTFEITGTAGGRRVFHYYADTVEHVLYLQDKYKAQPDRRNAVAGVGGDGPGNGSTAEKRIESAGNKVGGIYSDDWISAAAWKNIGDEVNFINPKANSTRRVRELSANKGKFDKRNRMVLKYTLLENGDVRLEGKDENQNDVLILLRKVNRTYVLSTSELEAGNY